jgi:chromosome segregation ATPase
MIPKSAENIRKLELSLDELVPKFKGRLDLIREDLKSLVSDIENLKIIIDENRRKSNDYTREISDLNNDLQAFQTEISEIEREISKAQNEIDSVKSQISEMQSDLLADKNRLSTLETEKSTLISTLNSLNTELSSLQATYEELQPKFDAQMKTLADVHTKLKTKKDGLANRYQAMRVLCSQEYLQSPEVGLVKFLAMKPSSTSTIIEIRSALGMDPSTLTTVLKGLAARNVLEFDEATENITLLQKIDLFDKEV